MFHLINLRTTQLADTFKLDHDLQLVSQTLVGHLIAETIADCSLVVGLIAKQVLIDVDSCSSCLDYCLALGRIAAAVAVAAAADMDSSNTGCFGSSVAAFAGTVGMD